MRRWLDNRVMVMEVSGEEGDDDQGGGGWITE